MKFSGEPGTDTNTLVGAEAPRGLSGSTWALHNEQAFLPHLPQAHPLCLHISSSHYHPGLQHWYTPSFVGRKYLNRRNPGLLLPYKCFQLRVQRRDPPKVAKTLMTAQPLLDSPLSHQDTPSKIRPGMMIISGHV